MEGIMCACGRPLHYTDKREFQKVQELISFKGPMIDVHCPDKDGVFWVYAIPRHYIALHGLKASELPQLVLDGIIKRERVAL